jgi:rod shape-determining protein MreD
MLRPLVTFLATFVLWTLVAQVNHALAPTHVYLAVGGLGVAVAALVLPLRAGLIASFLNGLVYDAAAPVAFGTHALLFALAHAILFNLRDRLPRDDTTGQVVIALIANLGVFLAFSFIQITRSPAPAAAWPRLIADLVASQLFLAFIAPWFFALHRRALALARAEPVRLL